MGPLHSGPIWRLELAMPSWPEPGPHRPRCL